jgi:signal transduction histidine kinase
VIGFDSAEIGPSADTTGRFGLFSIRIRLETLGGHMEVESKPGHGTRVTLVAPLKHNGENKKDKVSMNIKILLADEHRIMRSASDMALLFVS